MRRCISKYISILIFSFAVFFCSGCGKVQDTSHQLRVGMECCYAPFNWSQHTAENGAISIGGGEYAGGYDVEIAKNLAKELNKELVIVKVGWDGLLAALTSGKIDAILGGMSATEVRKYTIDFSDKYYTASIVVVTNKNNRFANAQSIEDLRGAKLTAQMNTIHYDLLKETDKITNVQPPRTDSASMIVGVSSGEIDGFVTETPVALSTVFSNPNLTYINFKENQGFNISEDEKTISIGFKKNNPLREEINKILANISEEQREILMKEAVKNQPSAQI